MRRRKSRIRQAPRAGENAGRNPETTFRKFILEGAIRRIFQGDHADRFGLKTSLKGGSLMFLAEGVDAMHGRGTTDIDVQITGYTGTLEELATIMREVLASVPHVDDGVRFDVGSVTVASQREGGVPGGKITAAAQVGRAHYEFKMDVGFYDPSIADTLVAVDYPSLLDHEPIRIWRQPIEYAISDKIHASHQHGGRNTRLQDAYDLYVFLTKCTVDDDRLREAFMRSWPIYGTDLPSSIDDIEGLTDEWAIERESLWPKRAVKDGWAVEIPPLLDVVRLIRERIGPVIAQGHKLAA